MTVRILETTIPALADQGQRAFKIEDSDSRLDIQVLAVYREDIGLAGDPPSLKITGNTAPNRELGLKLLGLAYRLLNDLSNPLPPP